MTTIYQTDAQQPALRFTYWRDLMRRTFALAHGSAECADDFPARCSVSELGAATVSTVSAPNQFWERTREHVRRSPRHEFLFTQLLSGRGVLRQDGQELVMQPGTMSIYNVNRPFTYELGGEILFVKLPHRCLMDRLGQQPRVCATALGAGTALADWTSDVVGKAAQLEDLSTAQTAELVGSSVLSAITALLGTASSGEKAACNLAASSQQLEHICTYIRSRLADSRLSLASIARAHDISERSLNRLFAGIGTTPMRWVLQQRLALSYRALREGQGTRVTDVAFTCGFNDLSHFSRVFKKAYQLTPQQLAASARQSTLLALASE